MKKLKIKTGSLWWQITASKELWYFDNSNDEGRYHSVLGLHWVERNSIRGLQLTLLGFVLLCAWLSPIKEEL